MGLELLGKSRSLADELGVELVGVLLVHGVNPLAEQATRYGADEVLVVDHPHLRSYRFDLHTDVLFHLACIYRPSILLLGATPNGRDLAARLAARLRTGLVADCVDLRIDPQTGLLLGITAGFGGGILATIQCPRHRPQMATVRPGVFPQPAPQSRTGTVRRVEAPVGTSCVEILERKTGTEEDLTTARVLVVGGGGTRGDFRLLRELADLMGGRLGATWVAVDAAWAPREWQIGQTGCTTRPQLAVVCGASGATQFTVGIEAAQVVVAVNVDEEAPIFEHADYGIPDDRFTFLPALIDRLRRMKQEGDPCREFASSSA
ncbi:MAG: electron transfer flavoprotein subunit alpha/FixB family protein [Armatimonadetes bacterium]|nr:electron transfer flavoprotein subunit alpha/FixB family protein [Armatimonadota bacterium]